MQIKDLKDKKIFFLDRDGTLALSGNKLEGTDEFLNYLKENNILFYIMTNNSSKTPHQFFEKFTKMGLEIKEENVLVSIHPTIDYLKENNYKNIFWLANSEVSKFLEEQGFVYDEQNPECALFTYDTELTYDKLNKLSIFLRSGLPYFVTHTDLVCPTDKGPAPDVGSFMKVIEISTGRLPDKAFGKPNKALVDSILKKHGLNYKDSVIVGDRLYTDIKLAENCDMTSLLVLSGETKLEDYKKSEITADIVAENLKEVVNVLKYS